MLDRNWLVKLVMLWVISVVPLSRSMLLSFNAVTPRPSLARMTKDALIVYARQFDLELDPQLLKSDLIEQIENTYATQ